MIYVIGGMKFSISKVRTSANLALYLSSVKKRRIAFVDSDPNSYSAKYLKWVFSNSDYTAFRVVKSLKNDIRNTVSELEPLYDDIIIDSGAGKALTDSLEIANKLIVPFNAKDLSLWAVWTLTNIETLIDKSLEKNPALESYSFLISKTGQENSARQISKALKRSQYLKFLDTFPFSQLFSEEDHMKLESLQGLKDCLPDYCLSELANSY